MTENLKKRLLIILISLVAAVVSVTAVCFAVSAATPDYSDATTKAYEAELERLKQEQTSIEITLAGIRGNKSSASEYAEYLHKQVENTSSKIDVTNQLLDTLAKRIEEKKKQISDETDRVDDTYRKFLNRIRIAYEEGRETYLEILLDSKSLTDFLSRTEQLNSLLGYDKRLKKSYEEAKKTLEEAKADLDASYEKQVEYSKSLEEDIVKLENSIKENDDYIATLENNEYYAYQQYLARQAERDKLDAELQDYILEQLRKSQENYAGGLLSWPLNPSTNYYVTDTFGWRSYMIYGYWTSDFHHGIDLRASVGTEVYAANSGIVSIATYNATYGYYVLIDHGGGYSTLYAHNSSLCVSPGDYVERGQRISYSGNTGYSSGPHLHFEVRYFGERIDPLAGNILNTPYNMVILD